MKTKINLFQITRAVIREELLSRGQFLHRLDLMNCLNLAHDHNRRYTKEQGEKSQNMYVLVLRSAAGCFFLIYFLF